MSVCDLAHKLALSPSSPHTSVSPPLWLNAQMIPVTERNKNNFTSITTDAPAGMLIRRTRVCSKQLIFKGFTCNLREILKVVYTALYR